MPTLKEAQAELKRAQIIAASRPRNKDGIIPMIVDAINEVRIRASWVVALEKCQEVDSLKQEIERLKDRLWQLGYREQ